jgi:hypothetical protein
MCTADVVRGAVLSSLLSACTVIGGKSDAVVDSGVCGDGTCAQDQGDARDGSDAGGGAVAVCGCIGDDCCADGACNAGGGGGVVIPVYLSATDTSAGDVDRDRATFDQMFSWVQSWYLLEMADHGCETFRVEPVRVFPSPHTRAQWDTYSTTCYPGQSGCDGNGTCSMWYAANTLLPPQLAGAGLPAIGSQGVLYYVINGGGTNGSCGGGGLAASERKIISLTQMNCPTGHYADGATDCSMVGVIAHEQGHAFGLPHAMDRPEGCTGGPSIMDVWWDYDRGASLCEEDRVDLEQSGYFYPTRK